MCRVNGGPSIPQQQKSFVTAMFGLVFTPTVLYHRGRCKGKIDYYLVDSSHSKPRQRGLFHSDESHLPATPKRMAYVSCYNVILSLLGQGYIIAIHIGSIILEARVIP